MFQLVDFCEIQKYCRTQVRDLQCMDLFYTAVSLLQTPIYEEVTDAKDNLAGALLFAGQNVIPEVGNWIHPSYPKISIAQLLK